jgi:hypothetical protein
MDVVSLNELFEQIRGLRQEYEYQSAQLIQHSQQREEIGNSTRTLQDQQVLLREEIQSTTR